MSVVATKGVITAGTSDGSTATPTLTGFSAGEPLRAVIFWASDSIAAGSRDLGSNVAGGLAIGFASNDGGSIQQGYALCSELDGVGTSDTARGDGTGAALKKFSANVTPTV